MNAALLLLLAALSPLALESVPEKPKVWPWVRQPTPRAYFHLQAADMDQSNPLWPESHLPYSIMVANSSISAAPGLVKANTMVPDCLLLAYRNFSDIEVANSRSGAFWDSLETVFDTTFCIRDLSTGKCVRMQDDGDTQPAWIPFDASIDAFMQHFDHSVWAKDFDGVYLDEYTDPYPNWRWALLPAHYDINGDDVEDDSLSLVEQRAAGRALLAQRIRASIGEDAVFVANTAGATAGGGCFNGITLEGVGGSGQSFASTIAELEAQRAVSVEPHVNVVWLTSSADEDTTVMVVRQQPGVWLGTIGD